MSTMDPNSDSVPIESENKISSAPETVDTLNASPPGDAVETKQDAVPQTAPNDKVPPVLESKTGMSLY